MNTKYNNVIKNYFWKGLLFVFILFSIDNFTNYFLLKGLHNYYGLYDNSEMALVGHSHLMLGLDKIKLEEGLKIEISKYTREGVNVAERDLMIDQLVKSNQKLKLVVYGVDAWMFTGEGLSENSYKQFYPFMNEEIISDYIHKNAPFEDFWQHFLIKSSRYNEALVSGSFRGYLKKWDNLKFGVVDTISLKEHIKKDQFRKIVSTKANRRKFEETLLKLSKYNIEVILFYVPTLGIYNNAESVKFNYEISYFKSLEIKNPNVIFLDYNDPYSSKSELFYDKIHLNPSGQKIITAKFVEDLQYFYKKHK